MTDRVLHDSRFRSVLTWDDLSDEQKWTIEKAYPELFDACPLDAYDDVQYFFYCGQAYVIEYVFDEGDQAAYWRIDEFRYKTLILTATDNEKEQAVVKITTTLECTTA
jgi:hypothetical protein